MALCSLCCEFCLNYRVCSVIKIAKNTMCAFARSRYVIFFMTHARMRAGHTKRQSKQCLLSLVVRKESPVRVADRKAQMMLHHGHPWGSPPLTHQSGDYRGKERLITPVHSVPLVEVLKTSFTHLP